MICDSCKRGLHLCPGGTWCDCQHRIEDLDLGNLTAKQADELIDWSVPPRALEPWKPKEA